MRQIRQRLRLVHGGIGAHEIGRLLGVARSIMQDDLNRAEAAEVDGAGAQNRTVDLLITNLLIVVITY